MARGNDERHNPKRKVDLDSFKAGDRVRHVWMQEHGEVHNYGTFASHAEEDSDGAYVQFDDPKKGAETYVSKSDLKNFGDF